MARFPTAAHLVSWAGLCPAANQSGPRTGRGKKKHGNAYLRGALGQAALGAARTGTFLGERYRRVARRRGKARAQVAVARSILIVIWHLLADPAARFIDLGPDCARLPHRPGQEDPQLRPPAPGHGTAGNPDPGRLTHTALIRPDAPTSLGSAARAQLR